MSQSDVPVVSAATLEVVPLGGLGEFGMNMMAISWEDTTILVDAGVMFPETGSAWRGPVVLIWRSRSATREVKALVLTHGHEDHIGRRPYVGQLSRSCLRHRHDAGVDPAQLEEHGIEARAAQTVQPRDTITVGPLTIGSSFHAQHADCVAWHHLPGRHHRHTRFQDRPEPIAGEHFASRSLPPSRPGVLAPFADSTNVARRASPT